MNTNLFLFTTCSLLLGKETAGGREAFVQFQ